MRSALSERLARLERRATAASACGCVQVRRTGVSDTAGDPPALCPHGRPWWMTIRVIREEGPAHA